MALGGGVHSLLSRGKWELGGWVVFSGSEGRGELGADGSCLWPGACHVLCAWPAGTVKGLRSGRV